MFASIGLPSLVVTLNKALVKHSSVKPQTRRLLALTFAAALGLLLLPSQAVRAATIQGTVFEDVNYGGGAGRSRASASGSIVLANVRVELYRQSTGALVDSDTTDASGLFSLSSGNGSSGAEAHIVRVVNGTVRSSRSSCTTCVAVQTYRTDASSGTAAGVTNRVGGENPALSDAAQLNSGNISSLATGTTTAQSITTVDPAASNSTVSGIDFGFNFDTIVNTRDASSCAPSGTSNTYYPCQGSLRQFIINANTLGGEGSLAQSGSGQLEGLNSSLPGGYESSIFMVPSAALSSGVALITLADTLTLTGANTRLDATTQTVNIGNTNAGTLGTGGTVGVDNISLPAFQRPEVELLCGDRIITLGGSNQSINGFALRQGYIALSGASGTARNNLVGMTASGVSSAVSGAAYGITFTGTNAIVRNNYVKVNNSGIRGDSPGSGAIVSFNEVARPDSGHTTTYDGILIVGNATNVLIENNLTRDQAGGGIELGFGAGSLTNVTVQNNSILNNGFASGSTPSSEPLGLVSYSYGGSNVLLYRNRIAGTAGPGLLVMQATNTRISQNAFSNNGNIGIDLDPRTTIDPNTHGAVNGVTINDNNDADTGPNGLLNFPVLLSANVVGSELYLRGFGRPGALLELYVAQADPTGFGEGLTYLTSLTEGSGSDLDATTGTYGPANVNGLTQGTDTTNRFFFRIAVPSGVAVGTTLTATATLSNQTSEFSGNLIVAGAPNLTHQKTVTVISDPLSGTTQPKSIPGAIERYAVRLTNTGPATVDGNSLSISDAIPANTALYVLDQGTAGSGPVAFVNGTPASGVTWTYTALNSTSDDLEFSNDGGTTWTYTPTPNANGCDPAVTHIRLRPDGTMAASSGAGNPWFELRFQVRVN